MASPNDDASLMMRGFATFYGKHRIIASGMSNIMFAKQIHHIAVGDASLFFDSSLILCYNTSKAVILWKYCLKIVMLEIKS